MAPAAGVASQHRGLAPDLDMLIVGAGLSGIDAAYRFQTRCAGKSYAILEARGAIGGTWDLFRYSGVRSDSDMHTLGFPFRPWRGKLAIAEGASICDYVRDTAEVFGIDRNIRFGHRVVRVSWSSTDSRWTVEAEIGDGSMITLTCRFLFMCSGYYDYAGGYTPDYPGSEVFGGNIVHPRLWPKSLDVAGKRVIVIGSGATAVTLVPALAARGASVTMLQRSPTYIVSRAARDGVARWAHRLLPGSIADPLIRWKNILTGIATYALSRHSPERVKRIILNRVRRETGTDYLARHFTPNYAPWDQRICLVPDGDLFTTLRAGKVNVVTDRIDRFNAGGIRLHSGRELPADLIVSATGLVIKLLGGAEVLIDGVPVNLSDRTLYKGMMLDGIPNLALTFGYTNASWTLKCDLTARYVCRLITHMDRHGSTVCMPRLRPDEAAGEPMLDFRSGYVQRALSILPKQGRQAPWRVHQNYLKDLLAMKFGAVDDGAMHFSAS